MARCVNQPLSTHYKDIGLKKYTIEKWTPCETRQMTEEEKAKYGEPKKVENIQNKKGAYQNGKKKQ